MHKSILKMEVEDLKFSTENGLPKYAHSAIICGQIGCGKKDFVLVCVEVLRPSQPNGVMSSLVSLPNHTFTGQA